MVTDMVTCLFYGTISKHNYVQTNVLENIFQAGSNPALTARIGIKAHQKPANR
jgi:hypothetical protein